MFPLHRPHEDNTISTVVCVLSFKPLFTSVYDLLHVVSSVSVTALVSGVGAGQNLYKCGNSNACFLTFKFVKCGLRKFSITYPCPHSPPFTMNSLYDTFICFVSCWGSFVCLLCTNFSVISMLKLIAHLNILITCTYKA